MEYVNPIKDPTLTLQTKTGIAGQTTINRGVAVIGSSSKDWVSGRGHQRLLGHSLELICLGQQHLP